MSKQVIQYNGATITIQPGTVRSRLYYGIVLRHFNITNEMSELELTLITQYASFLSHTEIEGDVGFYVPTNGATDEDYQRGLEAFQSSPEVFYETVLIPMLLGDETSANETALTPETSKKT